MNITLAKFEPKRMIGFSKSVSLPWDGRPAPNGTTPKTKMQVQNIIKSFGKTLSFGQLCDQTFNFNDFFSTMAQKSFISARL